MNQALNPLLPRNPGYHHHSTDEITSVQILLVYSVYLAGKKRQVPILVMFN
jgi:hypothetical protein